jgi:hypothetical protein
LNTRPGARLINQWILSNDRRRVSSSLNREKLSRSKCCILTGEENFYLFFPRVVEGNLLRKFFDLPQNRPTKSETENSIKVCSPLRQARRHMAKTMRCRAAHSYQHKFICSCSTKLNNVRHFRTFNFRRGRRKKGEESGEKKSETRKKTFSLSTAK